MGIKVVESYKYLGVHLHHATAETFAHMQVQIQSQIGGIVSKVKRMQIETRKLILNTMIHGVVLYQMLPFALHSTRYVKTADHRFNNFTKRILDIQT